MSFSVRSYLGLAVQPVITSHCLTGWRIKHGLLIATRTQVVLILKSHIVSRVLGGGKERQTAYTYMFWFGCVFIAKLCLHALRAQLISQ